MDSDNDYCEECYDSDDSFANNFIDDTIPKKNYIILNEEDIQKQLDNDVVSVSSLLSVPRSIASLLSIHYKWNVDSLQEAWFSDEEKVRRVVGLVENPGVNLPINSGRKLTCGICFENYASDDRVKGSCDHSYCSTCWTAYIGTSINGGPGCLFLRCPDPSCGIAISEDMVNLFVSEEDVKKYCRYFLGFYIEGKSNTKWCPGPGCNSVVEHHGCDDSVSYDVICSCSCAFCWNCSEDAHRPVDCETVAKWMMKNSSESESVNWILVNTKPCPKCKRSIEKNHGCMHMTCRAPCHHQFCWLCLGPWKGHQCNRYNGGEKNEAENRRETAKKSLERYTHYFERWDANHKSRNKAIAEINKAKTIHLNTLAEEYAQTEMQLKFVVECWLQIIECRRVLKWSYAYGYYIPEDQRAKAKLFEYLQGEAESGLERLHKCAEKELAEFLKSGKTANEFECFRLKTIGLTQVTRNFFANLVTALENDLCEAQNNDPFDGEGGKKRKSNGMKKKQGKRRIQKTD